jgi:hypothetical protein
MRNSLKFVLLLLVASVVSASPVPNKLPMLRPAPDAAQSYSPAQLVYSPSDGSFHAIANGVDTKLGSGNAVQVNGAAVPTSQPLVSTNSLGQLVPNTADIFGAGPSSGYTFTSTPITTNPFNGNLLIATATNPFCNSTYGAGSGFSLVSSATGACIGVESATGGSASSYTGAFTYGTSQVWSATIFALTATNPVFVQGKYAAGGISSLAFTSSPTAGNFLLAVIDYGSSHAPVTSVTDTLGNTWALIGLRAPEDAVKGVGNGDFQEIWYVANCLGGSADTVAFNGGASGAISLLEESGVATINPVVDYAYNPDGTGNTASTTFSGATTNAQYTIKAVNNITGTIDFTGRDSGAVFRSAANNLASTGGLLYYKDGVYPGQTALQESAASQTNFYIWGLPAPTGTGANRVDFHIECESKTFDSYAVVPSNGCNHIVMPSAYSGAEPSAQQLSGFWQRPNATVGAKGNNQDFFVYGNVQIPSNQVPVATIAYDTYTSSYSSHIGTYADTAIPVSDQLCSGLAVPTNTGIVAYRTNQSSTDESYFKDTWAVGFYTPENVLTNHAILVNAHAVCNVTAAIFAVSSSLYGGIIEHYQDIHNITGPQFNCTQPGTRFDVINQVTEDAESGSFARTSNASESVNGNCVVRGSNLTADANAVSFNPTPFFATGSGANSNVVEAERLIQPGLVTSNFTSAATTGTTKQTLATYTFAFNTSGGGPNTGPFINNPGAVFRIKAWGVTATNSNSKTFELDFGGTAIATITSTASNKAIYCESEIIVSSTANVQSTTGLCTDGTVTNPIFTAPGITGNANIVLNAAATTGTASGDFTFKGMTIEYVGGS